MRRLEHPLTPVTELAQWSSGRVHIARHADEGKSTIGLHQRQHCSAIQYKPTLDLHLDLHPSSTSQRLAPLRICLRGQMRSCPRDQKPGKQCEACAPRAMLKLGASLPTTSDTGFDPSRSVRQGAGV